MSGGDPYRTVSSKEGSSSELCRGLKRVYSGEKKLTYSFPHESLPKRLKKAESNIVRLAKAITVLQEQARKI